MSSTTHTVHVPNGPSFQVCVPPPGRDPVADEMAGGGCPQSRNWDLFLGLLRPGEVVLDLGAHLGSFALPAAALGCRVIAFEAAPGNADLLRASAAANGFGPDRLAVVHAAVSDRPGELRFDANGPFGSVDPDGGVRVPAVAVDEALAAHGVDRVGFVKMDVEGWEPAALRGMTRVLGGPAAPPVFYESNGFTLHKFGHTCRDLKAAAARLGYQNHHVDTAHARLVPVAPDDPQPECCVDYLAVKSGSGWRRLFGGRGPARVGRWPVAAPLTRDEWRAWARACCDPGAFWPHREHAVREFAAGPDWLRADPAVAAFLHATAGSARRAG